MSEPEPDPRYDSGRVVDIHDDEHCATHPGEPQFPPPEGEAVEVVPKTIPDADVKG
jgi:hypothetical protein